MYKVLFICLYLSSIYAYHEGTPLLVKHCIFDHMFLLTVWLIQLVYSKNGVDALHQLFLF